MTYNHLPACSWTKNVAEMRLCIAVIARAANKKILAWVTLDIALTQRMDSRGMDDTKDDIGTQCSLTGQLVRSRMPLTDHLIRTCAGALPSRA